MKKTVIKILTITVGVLAALAAVAGVVYLLKKKKAGKTKKYVCCPPEENCEECGIDGVEETYEELDEVADDNTVDAE